MVVVSCWWALFVTPLRACMPLTTQGWDMNRPLEEDTALELCKFDSQTGRDTFWHSRSLNPKIDGTLGQNQAPCF